MNRIDAGAVAMYPRDRLGTIIEFMSVGKNLSGAANVASVDDL